MTDWSPPTTPTSARPQQPRDARLAALADRRERPAPRRHPARRARIAATGLGLTTMLGLVAAMDRSSAPSSDSGVVPEPSAGGSSEVVVVLPEPSATGGAVAPAPPVVLAARPVVQPAPAATSAPAAKTHGSR